MSEHNKISSNTKPALSHRDLVGTLYQSFALAQGELQSSYAVLELSSDYYKGKYSSQAVGEALDTVPKDIANRLFLPRNHASFEPQARKNQPRQTVEERVVEEFATYWDFFSEKLRSPDRTTSQNRLQLVSSISLKLAQVDRGYMQTIQDGEPYAGRTSKTKDTRFSIFREHILNGKKLGNAALDTVLDQTQNALRSIDNYPYYDKLSKLACSILVNQELPILAAAWEAHHPGEHFVKPDQYAGTLLLASAQSRPPSVGTWMAENMPTEHY